MVRSSTKRTSETGRRRSSWGRCFAYSECPRLADEIGNYKIVLPEMYPYGRLKELKKET